MIGVDRDTMTIAVRVLPKSSRSEIRGWKDGILQVRTTAAPVDGKANADVVRQLARAFGVPRSRIELVRGATGRDKLFRISGISAEPRFPDLGA